MSRAIRDELTPSLKKTLEALEGLSDGDDSDSGKDWKAASEPLPKRGQAELDIRPPSAENVG